MEKLATYLQEEPEDTNFNFDNIYRVNSSYAQQTSLPWDVVVSMISKKMRYDILIKHMNDPLETEGNKMRTMEELPKEIV